MFMYTRLIPCIELVRHGTHNIVLMETVGLWDLQWNYCTSLIVAGCGRSGPVVSLHRHIDCKLVTISLYCTPKKRKGCISFYRSDEHLNRALDECTRRKVYVCLHQYRGNTQRLVQKLRMNQWPLELLNQIKLLDACAENRFRGSLTLECMWVCCNY